MCVFFLPPLTAVVIPATSAPHTTIYKVADVPRQPSNPKTSAHRRTWSSNTLQTGAGVSKTAQEVDPNLSKATPGSQIPGQSQNQLPWKEDTNKNIPASPPAVDPVKKTQGIRSGPSQTNPASLKNVSEVTPGQVQPEPNISNTISKTVSQASGRDVPSLGKPLTKSVYRSRRPQSHRHLINAICVH